MVDGHQLVAQRRMYAPPLGGFSIADGHRNQASMCRPAFEPPPDQLLRSGGCSALHACVVQRLALVGVPDHGEARPRELQCGHEHRVGHDDHVSVTRVFPDQTRPLLREPTPWPVARDMDRTRPWWRCIEPLRLASAQDGRRHPQACQTFSENPGPDLEATIRLDDRAEGYEQRPKANRRMIIAVGSRSRLLL